MQRIRTVIVVVLALGALGPAGLAIAHELPGEACSHAADGKNKHCGEHVHGEGDGDGDGIPVTTRVQQDNCRHDYNPEQGDVDDDGIGNVCDHALDGDGDGVCDAPVAELCAAPPPDGDRDDPRYATDTDGDGFGDEDEDAVGGG